MQKILVPIDFTSASEYAADFAIQVAQETGAEVEFMHVLLTAIDWSQVPKENEKLYPSLQRKIADTREKLQRYVETAKRHHVKASETLSFAEDHLDMVEHLNYRSFELIVMGSYGAKGYKERFIGSNAQKVVRFAQTPVIVVKHPIKHLPQRLAFASYFDPEGIDAIEELLPIAVKFKAKIDLLFVNTPHNFTDTVTTTECFEQVRKKYYAHREMFDFHVFNYSTVEEGISQFLTHRQNDMLAVVNHDKSPLAKFFTGSTVEDLINHLELPVLVVRGD